ARLRCRVAPLPPAALAGARNRAPRVAQVGNGRVLVGLPRLAPAASRRALHGARLGSGPAAESLERAFLSLGPSAVRRRFRRRRRALQSCSAPAGRVRALRLVLRAAP